MKVIPVNTAWVRARLCKLQKWVHSIGSASDKAYQFLSIVGGSFLVLRLLPPLKLVNNSP
jgi:hypothetical protein